MTKESAVRKPVLKSHDEVTSEPPCDTSTRITTANTATNTKQICTCANAS